MFQVSLRGVTLEQKVPSPHDSVNQEFPDFADSPIIAVISISRRDSSIARNKCNEVSRANRPWIYRSLEQDSNYRDAWGMRDK